MAEQKVGNWSIYFDKERNNWVGELRWTYPEPGRKIWRNKKQKIVKSEMQNFRQQLLEKQAEMNLCDQNDVLFADYAKYWLRLSQKNLILPIKILMI